MSFTALRLTCFKSHHFSRTILQVASREVMFELYFHFYLTRCLWGAIVTAMTLTLTLSVTFELINFMDMPHTTKWTLSKPQVRTVMALSDVESNTIPVSKKLFPR